MLYYLICEGGCFVCDIDVVVLVVVVVTAFVITVFNVDVILDMIPLLLYIR